MTPFAWIAFAGLMLSLLVHAVYAGRLVGKLEYLTVAVEKLAHALERQDARSDDHEIRIVKLEEKQNA